MNDRMYWLGFSVFPGIGPMKFTKLLGKFGSAKTAWHASLSDLSKSSLGDVLGKKFDEFRNSFSIRDYGRKLQEKDVSFLIQTDEAYPKRLAKIKNPPFVLHVRGDFDFDDLNHQSTIAVVGTRRITQYGKEVTRILTGELVSEGFAIVSGLAVGVDGIAHKSALENNGKTIAVLGCGVDCCSPKENQYLYNEIIQKGGSIISELPLGHLPSRGTFPSRNRIIAGLSVGVLVTEGSADSGALITADYAIKNNRPVFAVPGPITSDLSKGPVNLIKKGATLVTSADDILNEIGIQKKAKSNKQKAIRGDTKEEEKILQLLQNEPMHFDEIVRRLGMNPSTTGSILSIMEIKGMVRDLEAGVFSIAS